MKVPIITYHSIDDSGSVISTSPEVFRRQMRFLHDKGFHAVTLREFAKSMGNGASDTQKVIVLTFDDGFRNFFTEALPVLHSFGFRATVFVVTGHCGEFNDWRGNPTRMPRSELLSWDELRELDRAGIEIGSHTVTHCDLTNFDVARIENEVADSKAMIEQQLGRATCSFAYPFGRMNSEIRDIAARHYMAACTTRLGKVSSDSDPFSLRRLDAYYFSNQRLLESLESPVFDLYMGLRQALRTTRSLMNRG